jgi:hypothetical protein
VVIEILSSGGKRLGREVDHSPPSGVEVNNEAAPLLPPFTLIAWTGETFDFRGGREQESLQTASMRK